MHERPETHDPTGIIFFYLISANALAVLFIYIMGEICSR